MATLYHNGLETGFETKLIYNFRLSNYSKHVPLHIQFLRIDWFFKPC